MINQCYCNCHMYRFIYWEHENQTFINLIQNYSICKTFYSITFRRYVFLLRICYLLLVSFKINIIRIYYISFLLRMTPDLVYSHYSPFISLMKLVNWHNKNFVMCYNYILWQLAYFSSAIIGVFVA